MFIRVITQDYSGKNVVGRTPYIYFDIGSFSLVGQAKALRKIEIDKQILVLEKEATFRRSEEERLLKEKIAREK